MNQLKTVSQFRAQACVGPSIKKIHLRDRDNNEKPQLSLCESIAVNYDYKDGLAPPMLCRACMKKYFARVGVNSVESAAKYLSPDALGVSDII